MLAFKRQIIKDAFTAPTPVPNCTTGPDQAIVAGTGMGTTMLTYDVRNNYVRVSGTSSAPYVSMKWDTGLYAVVAVTDGQWESAANVTLADLTTATITARGKNDAAHNTNNDGANYATASGFATASGRYCWSLICFGGLAPTLHNGDLAALFPTTITAYELTRTGLTVSGASASDYVVVVGPSFSQVLVVTGGLYSGTISGPTNTNPLASDYSFSVKGTSSATDAVANWDAHAYSDVSLGYYPLPLCYSS